MFDRHAKTLIEIAIEIEIEIEKCVPRPSTRIINVNTSIPLSEICGQISALFHRLKNDYDYDSDISFNGLFKSA
ncbi:hypothetical protein P0Y35_08215 [Kiritimatiellaeota bacterium B1221]|nr:hypothetical protein [Kiritimatiellaeota bacterium B1221]